MGLHGSVRKSYKSVKGYSNSNRHSHNTLFWLEKVIKKGNYVKESLGLAWDRVKLSQVALYITTLIIDIHYSSFI